MRKGGDTAAVLAAGLPEIGGNINNVASWNGTDVSGAFTCTQSATDTADGDWRGVYRVNLTFAASNFNSIYDNSDTVQPPAIQLIPQIKY